MKKSMKHEIYGDSNCTWYSVIDRQKNPGKRLELLDTRKTDTIQITLEPL